MDPSIKPWMSGSPVWVEAQASALEAHDRMVEYGIRHLPVLDAERRVVGVLSIDDLRAALPIPLSLMAPSTPEALEAARDWQVGDVMSYAPQTIREGSSLREAADRMADHRIGCLPVVDETGRLAAMLTETDLLRALATRVWLDEQVARQESEADREPAIVGRGPDESPARQEKTADLDQLVDGLRRERARIAERLDVLHAEERELSDELGEQPMDSADAGAELRQTRLDEGLENMAARRLEAIDRALDHAAQGRLSICDQCGGSIPVTRLRAVPGTTLCVSCASEQVSGVEPETPFERVPGGRAETGRPELGSRVYTRRFGEGVLVRIAPFGTCPRCGDVEGERDLDRDLPVCGSEGCGRPLDDVNELATVAVEEQEVFVDPAELRCVDPAPYD